MRVHLGAYGHGLRNKVDCPPMTPIRGRAAQARDYDTEAHWTEADLRLLSELNEAERLLPQDAPRALLSVRLSVFNEETTSPVRQELDLRVMARERGWRVVGVASDLNVSATKVKPWERPELGKWIRDRVPEFDVLAFWKLDRFIRNIGDLNQMVQWSEKYEKNLVSRHDPIDLTTPMGKAMVTFIAAVAEIEAANTALRVSSTWERTKMGAEWTVGKPPYGYKVQRQNGRNILVINEDEYRVLHAARVSLLAGDSISYLVNLFKQKGWVSGGTTVATMTRRLRSPALLGYRVEEDKNGGNRRSKMVFGSDGEPIRVAPPIFTQQEYDELQAALDKRSKSQPARNPAGGTRFLGVLKCADCGTNMTVQQFTKRPSPTNRLKNERSYSYLRCQNCPNGGAGAPNPTLVYEAVVAKVLEELGDYTVQHREYARGEEMRRRVAELEERIAYYMEGLEPGGRYTKTEFTQRQAEQAMDRLIAELGSIDRSTTEDRWVLTAQGRTFREHWEEEGDEAMASDLVRVGVEVIVTRTKVPGERAPKVSLKLRIPEDVDQRLVVKGDDFTPTF